MTNLKLNKLLYYAQGAYLARTGQALFGEEIQAWDYGPVVPVIYKKYKRNNDNKVVNPILKVSKNYSYTIFNPDELEVLLDVMREKGKFTGHALIKMTHNESPWKEVYKPNVKGLTISKESLKEYFTKYPIEKKEISKKVKVVKALPKEYYDPSEDEFWKECRDEG